MLINIQNAQTTLYKKNPSVPTQHPYLSAVNISPTSLIFLTHSCKYPIQFCIIRSYMQFHCISTPNVRNLKAKIEKISGFLPIHSIHRVFCLAKMTIKISCHVENPADNFNFFNMSRGHSSGHIVRNMSNCSLVNATFRLSCHADIPADNLNKLKYVTRIVTRTVTRKIRRTSLRAI